MLLLQGSDCNTALVCEGGVGIRDRYSTSIKYSQFSSWRRAHVKIFREGVIASADGEKL